MSPASADFANTSITSKVGTMKAPCSTMLLAVSSSRMLPCSIDRTPAASAFLTEGEVWQWARTYLPAISAS